MAARNVVSFDVGGDESVIYSNGFAVFRLVDGDWQEVARANLIENVCAS